MSRMGAGNSKKKTFVGQSGREYNLPTKQNLEPVKWPPNELSQGTLSEQVKQRYEEMMKKGLNSLEKNQRKPAVKARGGKRTQKNKKKVKFSRKTNSVRKQ